METMKTCVFHAGYEAMGGWRFGNTINGAQAEFLLVPRDGGIKPLC